MLAAQRAFAQTRRLRHPCVLQWLDGAETETEIVVITSEVVPLSEWLASGGCAATAAGGDAESVAPAPAPPDPEQVQCHALLVFTRPPSG